MQGPRPWSQGRQALCQKQGPQSWASQPRGSGATGIPALFVCRTWQFTTCLRTVRVHILDCCGSSPVLPCMGRMSFRVWRGCDRAWGTGDPAGEEEGSRVRLGYVRGMGSHTHQWGGTVCGGSYLPKCHFLWELFSPWWYFKLVSHKASLLNH
jgi:hypothetical protein